VKWRAVDGKLLLDPGKKAVYSSIPQQAPYAHEYFYTFKTIQSGDFLSKHLKRRIDRYGHCNFTVAEAVSGLVSMLFYDDTLIEMDTVNAFPGDESSRAEFMKIGNYSTARRRWCLFPQRIADLLEMHRLFSACPNSLRSNKGRLLLKSRRISRRDPFGQTHHRRLAAE